ncbi:MAG TPA: hypothetical protein VF750_00215 [Sphingomicrobium sp.]
MLVYGDHRERADPAERLTRLGQTLEMVGAMQPGIERHAKLVRALIEAGQLLQSMADEGVPDASMCEFVHALAGCVLKSWDSEFEAVGTLPSVPRLSAAQVELRLPEGFAFYAVYPEAYAEAARKLKLAGPPRVIGIRSIGTTLAAIVAAALDAPPAVTVRPSGDPFARTVELAPEIVEGGAHYVIVDEGPGLSGSSFGSVADALEQRGVPLDRIAFLPSHAGDLGPQASEAHRARWSQTQRIAAEFDPSFLEKRFGPLRPFSGGGAWQRLKFIGDRDSEPVLLKFAGLGALGERKLEMARSLHAAALTPEPLELVHGFLVERWCYDATALKGEDRPVEEIGRYISARARLFPAPEASGASIRELLIMCKRNVGLAFGDEVARRLDRFDVSGLERRVRRMRTDNKLDREEWLRLPDGRLLKTDAVDHHQGHDLIGCQGLEWDIAGAIEEFDLTKQDSARLFATVGNADPDLLAFYQVAYGAFRLGQAHMSGDVIGADRYGRSLQHLLVQDC